MTVREMLEKIKTEESRRKIAEEIALVWLKRMIMKDVEQCYIGSSISGCSGLMSCSEEKLVEFAIDAGIVEKEFIFEHNIDWGLLNRQKQHLLTASGSCDDEVKVGLLGILNLLDSLQDQAVEAGLWKFPEEDEDAG